MLAQRFKRRVKVSVFIERLYYFMAISIMHLISLVIGLFFLSHIGSLETSYQVIDKMYQATYREKVRIFKTYLSNFKVNFKRTYLRSIGTTALIFIGFVDLIYFYMIDTPIHTGAFYIGIILYFIYIHTLLLSSFLDTKYELSKKELIKNSVSIIIVNIVDFLLMTIVIGIIGYALYKFAFILILILFPGIVLEFTYYYYKNILAKRSITNMIFNVERRSE